MKARKHSNQLNSRIDYYQGISSAWRALSPWISQKEPCLSVRAESSADRDNVDGGDGQADDEAPSAVSQQTPPSCSQLHGFIAGRGGRRRRGSQPQRRALRGGGSVCECRSVLWFHTSCLAHRAISYLLAVLVLLSGTARKDEDST